MGKAVEARKRSWPKYLVKPRHFPAILATISVWMGWVLLWAYDLISIRELLLFLGFMMGSMAVAMFWKDAYKEKDKEKPDPGCFWCRLASDSHDTNAHQAWIRTNNRFLR